MVDNIGVYVIDVKYLGQYCEHYRPTILRYDKRTKVDFRHSCDIYNYGGAKGATYERVVIVPVSTTLPFIEKQTKITSNQTRAKFYVACTRAKHSVVFAINNPKENTFFKAVDMRLANNVIPAYKYEKRASTVAELK